jgi:hypothetical protein
VPGTRSYGSCYFGNGEKNLDLPFMLWDIETSTLKHQPAYDCI